MSCDGKSARGRRLSSISAPSPRYCLPSCRGELNPPPSTVHYSSNINSILIRRYEHQEIALNGGMMLRECARYEALAKIMLYSEDFFNFFRYVEVSTFDIASDAFSTFKVSYYVSLIVSICDY